MEAGAPFSAKRLAAATLGAGLCLGLLAGLLAGWLVWPVRWHDTDPSDLRLEHQIDYVLMTADSLVNAGDSASAERRLRELTDEDTSWEQVANLVMRVAVLEDISGRPAAGDRVRFLFDTLAMPDPNAHEFVAPRGGASRGMWIGGGALALGGLVCLGLAAMELRGGRSGLLMAILAALLSAANGLADLIRRLTRPRPRPRTPAEVLQGGAAPVARPPSAAGGRRPIVVVDESTAGIDTVDADVAEGEEGAEEEWADEEEDLAGPADNEASAEGAAVDREDEYPLALGVWEAEYRLGDSDFDCAFSIEDEEGRYLGECGVGIADVLDANGSSAVQAFEVWLFDKNDVRTVSTILVSDYAYRHDALSAELGNKGDLELAQPGQVLTLETMHLQMTATIKAVAYAKGGPGPNSAFGALTVELVVEPADAG